MKKIIAYILNDIELKGVVPVEIVSGAILRRAKIEEIEDIDNRNKLASTATFIQIPSYRHKYNIKNEGASVSYTPVLIPESEWRYWVVDFEGDESVFYCIEKLLILANPPIHFSFCRITGLTSPFEAVRALRTGVLERSEYLWWQRDKNLILETTQVTDVCSSFFFLMEKNSKYQFARDAVDKFYDLQRLPPVSDMYILGLFSIIESLITHSPRLQESLDSITHQLINKLILIDGNFLCDPIDSKLFFGEHPHPTIWKKLYQFRSQLAHTSVASLPKELAILKSRDAICYFVEAKTKELIRFALKNPKLLFDIKAC